MDQPLFKTLATVGPLPLWSTSHQYQQQPDALTHWIIIIITYYTTLLVENVIGPSLSTCIDGVDRQNSHHLKT